MKRKSWMLGVLFVLIILVSYMAKPEKTQNDLLLMNIEALAAGEDYVPIQCIGTGTVPFRRKDKVCHDWLQP